MHVHVHVHAYIYKSIPRPDRPTDKPLHPRISPPSLPPYNSAGELTQEKLEEVIAIVSNPKAFKIPDWFLNRQRDWKTGKSSQATSNVVDTKLREDLERLKKVRYVQSINSMDVYLSGWGLSLLHPCIHTRSIDLLYHTIPHKYPQLEPRYPPLLGRACARAAHQDHGPPRQDGGAGREGEVRMES